jgi:hypothetical protein
MDIDAIIAEATIPVAEPQAAAPEVADNQEQVEQVTAEAPQEEDLSKKTDDELTPEQLAKRQANRKSHENSKLAQMRREAREAKAQAQQLQAEIERLRQGNQPKTEPKAGSEEPKLDDYETWEDYNKALIKFEAKQIREAENKQTQETQKNQELTKWVDERSSRVDTRITELAQSIPDFENTLEDIEDSIPALSPELARVALEADDINLAAYTLHKEGKLLEVLRMPPMRAAMEIAKAEVRGAAYLKQPKQVTSAPAPLSPAKGTGSGSKSIERMTPNELKEWLAS